MKIGILTYNSVSNYGALFQAYALQKTLEKHENSVELIEYWPAYRLTPLFRNPFSQPTNRSIIKWVLASAYSFFVDLITFHHKNRRIKYFKDFHSANLNNSKEKYYSYEELVSKKPKYDLYIAGSDQLWRRRDDIGFDKGYFLKFVETTNCKATYAISFGRSSLDSTYLEEFRELTQDIDWISVREPSAVQYVAEASGKDVVWCLDPTLLLDQDEWGALAEPPAKRPDKYVLVYNLNRTPSLVAFAELISKKLHLPVIYLCYGKHRYFSISNYVRPEEWLWYFRNATFVVTDSFHGTIFSIINRKPFYTIQQKSNSTRVHDLLGELGIPDRLHYPGEVPFEVDSNIDYNTVYQRLSELRKKSVNYLYDVESQVNSR